MLNANKKFVIIYICIIFVIINTYNICYIYMYMYIYNVYKNIYNICYYKYIYNICYIYMYIYIYLRQNNCVAQDGLEVTM
jgi:hypothetical protein